MVGCNVFRHWYKQFLNFDQTKFNLLHDEFMDYQSLFIEGLSLEGAIQETEKITEEDKVQYRIEVIWQVVQEMKLPAGDSFQFKFFLNVTNIVLKTPHSKADIERMYSLANKNKPEWSERSMEHYRPFLT